MRKPCSQGWRGGRGEARFLAFTSPPDPTNAMAGPTPEMAPADERPVVAVDCDEVLCQFVPAMAAYHNHHHGTNLTLADFHSYRFCEVGASAARRPEGSGSARRDRERDQPPIRPRTFTRTDLARCTTEALEC